MQHTCVLATCCGGHVLRHRGRRSQSDTPVFFSTFLGLKVGDVILRKAASAPHSTQSLCLFRRAVVATYSGSADGIYLPSQAVAPLYIYDTCDKYGKINTLGDRCDDLKFIHPLWLRVSGFRVDRLGFREGAFVVINFTGMQRWIRVWG